MSEQQAQENVTIKKQGIKERYIELKKKHDKKSPIIRQLAADGYDRTQIKNVMGIRYQHVRGVLITPLTGKQK